MRNAGEAGEVGKLDMGEDVYTVEDGVSDRNG